MANQEQSDLRKLRKECLLGLSEALSDCQMLEQEMKGILNSKFQLIEFKELKPLGEGDFFARLINRFKQISTNEKMIAELEKAKEIRNKLAHELFYQVNISNDERFLNDTLKWARETKPLMAQLTVRYVNETFSTCFQLLDEKGLN